MHARDSRAGPGPPSACCVRKFCGHTAGLAHVHTVSSCFLVAVAELSNVTVRGKICQPPDSSFKKQFNILTPEFRGKPSTSHWQTHETRAAPTAQQEPPHELVGARPHSKPVRSAQSLSCLRGERDCCSSPFCGRVGGCGRSNAASLNGGAAAKHKTLRKETQHYWAPAAGV